MRSKVYSVLMAMTLVGGSYGMLRGDSLGAETPEDDIRAGGRGTVYTEGAEAYANPFPALEGIDRLRFSSGNSLFTSNWVAAPASAAGRDGLGPLFNARACASCHVEDGRGAPPAEGEEPTLGLLFRISGTGPHSYGDQIQNLALPGVAPEASISVHWVPVDQTLADGTIVSLRRPEVSFQQLAYGPLPADLSVSPRLAPPMIGLGLLEAVDEGVILEAADPDDKDQDGISGRANYVVDHASGKTVLGRFGWKANQPNLKQQIAGAFLGDMGLTTSLFPEENCTLGQSPCKELPNGGQPEVIDKQLDAVLHYSRFLAVPARRFRDAGAEAGRQLFKDARCEGCHRPSLVTANDAAHPLLSGQKIWPYTDLLLHDMGEDLADHRPDGLANGREWRTPPLWGLGLNGVVNNHIFFLHDGRARSIEEAILWHGGEASASRDAYRSFSAQQRSDLLEFLKSL